MQHNFVVNKSQWLAEVSQLQTSLLGLSAYYATGVDEITQLIPLNARGKSSHFLAESAILFACRSLTLCWRGILQQTLSETAEKLSAANCHS